MIEIFNRVGGLKIEQRSTALASTSGSQNRESEAGKESAHSPRSKPVHMSMRRSDENKPQGSPPLGRSADNRSHGSSSKSQHSRSLSSPNPVLASVVTTGKHKRSDSKNHKSSEPEKKPFEESPSASSHTTPTKH